MAYTNNESGSCSLLGQVVPKETYNLVDCVGSIFRVWEYTEPCGRTITHNQKISVINTSTTNEVEKEIAVKTSLNSKNLLIELDNNLKSKLIKVTNIEGKVIYSGEIENKLEMDISSFTSGIYFISIHASKQIYTHKFFIP